MKIEYENCHECGGKMFRDTQPCELEYKGEKAIVDMSGYYCESCGESVHTGNDLDIYDQAVREVKIRADKLLRPEEVRRIRKKLRLSQRAAGEILGGGPRAFQKYEKGAVMVSRPMANLLRLLARYPKMVDELRV